ncbi:transporter substrate-binding domain-containing protein [Alteribacter keqinensis]|uniref:histidine kinase n=1 Tax=Alteribacter keqinensis TaxID=2483800 RepID=A0A3M7TR21_9BACI|nr:transporter substrate-binding domain-containing protein [Alteribacter keqinensis]RNA67629.1 PAS domain S-box protein [Alteribacter keqinensis]
MMKGIIVFLCFILVGTFSMSVSAETGEPLRVGYDPELPPLHFNDDGVRKGFAIDVMDEVAERMGRSIVYIEVPRREGVAFLENDTIDVMLSGYFNDEDARSVEFTDDYISTSVGLFVHKSNDKVDGLADLGEVITALERDTLEYEFLRNIRGIRYHTASTPGSAIDLLISGRADAFVGNMLTADYELERQGVRDDYKTIGSYLLPVEYSMVVQGENYLLMDQINRALRDVRGDGTYNDLYENWFAGESELADQLWLIIQIIGTLLILTLILFLIGVKWNRQLQREVNKKTNVLNQLNQSLQHQVEQTQSSDEFKKQILNSSPRGIATVDREGMITSFNKKAGEMAGIKEDAVSMHYQDVRILNQLLKDKFEHVFDSSRLYLGEDAEWKRDDGRLYFLRYYVYPLYDLNKKATGIIVTFEDVTEEKKLRMQMFEQEKNQALGRVVAGIAHEIRNPLTSIKTFVELIPRKYNNPRFQKEVSTYVPQEIERVNTLIEGLIDYAKPKQINKEIMEAGSFLEECTILFKRTAINSGFDMVCETEKDLYIEADENQLKQVVINLILNGIDAMTMSGTKEQKTLRLAAFQKGRQVVIKVEDEGIGMSEEEKKQAMEPFFTTKAKGTGLGLAIVQQYVRDNNGQLMIESKEGRGTSVFLAFDRVERGYQT